MADLPPYTQGDDDVQRSYQEELSQTLIQNIGVNGFVIPSVTTAQLTTNVIIDPSTGALTSLASLIPDGGLWFCNDHSPPCLVTSVAGTLYQISTSAFP